jgi:hypothetical protein
MKAELKRLHSPDVDDLENFVPMIADDFGFLLQIIVGPAGDPGEESFDLVVCTPDWLKRRYKSSDIVVGHERILVFEYNYERLRAFIARYCEKCVAGTWLEIASKLSRIGRWEFEGYQPHR